MRPPSSQTSFPIGLDYTLFPACLSIVTPSTAPDCEVKLRSLSNRHFCTSVDAATYADTPACKFPICCNRDGTREPGGTHFCAGPPFLHGTTVKRRRTVRLPSADLEAAGIKGGLTGVACAEECGGCFATTPLPCPATKLNLRNRVNRQVECGSLDMKMNTIGEEDSPPLHILLITNWA